MSYFKTFIGACLIASALSQGFIPAFRPVPHEQTIERRQLTPVQQTHILSDIQQHQHRFAVHQQQQLQPSFGQKSQGQGQGPILGPLSSQRYPVDQQRQFASNQNSFRTAGPSPNSRVQIFPSQQPVQHHTQTNFIPNFVQQPQLPTPQAQQQSFQSTQRFPQHQSQQPRSIQNQLQQTQFNQPFLAQPNTLQQITQPTGNPALQTIFPQPQFPRTNFVQQQSQNNLNQQLPIQHQTQAQQNQIFIGNQQYPTDQSPQVVQIQPTNQLLQQQQSQFVQSGLNFVQPNQFGNFLPQQSQNPQQSVVFQDPKLEEERQKEIRERQKLIEKHEKFVQKQYQKQQQKVNQEHQEFVKQQQKIQQQSQERLQPYRSSHNHNYFTRSRGILASEVPLFDRALQEYFIAHPTTTTTTTTEAPSTTTTVATSPKSIRSRTKEPTILDAENLEAILQGQTQKLFNQLKQETENGKTKSGKKGKSTKSLGRDDLIKQLKLALAEQPQDLGGSNYTSMDLVLPDGQKVQVIRTTDPNLVKGASPLNEETLSQLSGKSSNQHPISFEDLTKQGILPPGANFEVIKQSENGELQEVSKLPSEKKVTFVYLEEQNDGSYKVQGVKGNGDKEAKTSGVEVDKILQRIKDGEIQLPPSVKNVSPQHTTVKETITRSTVNIPSPSSVTVIPLSTPYEERFSTPSSIISTRSVFSSPVSPYSTLSTIAHDESTFRLSSASSTHFPSTTASSFPSSISSTYSPQTAQLVETTLSQSSSGQSYETSTPQYTKDKELAQILKNSGLHAMAKYLKQSGLDSILNETGPYTVFAPTDKAFKSLLVQLGGPERAEEKFKSNPRLLSGLLLHHVIPGSFEISALQDEMTGVSLAGTQLRVNQYTLHDSEWNDVTVTTINGAMVVPDKQDIKIPQGIAHAVDRVMFPLPVGDILQTLQSDRERRFTQFLRAVFASGLSDLFQNKGPKTYTVFAPTDAAFANLTMDELNRMVTDKDLAQTLVMKHLTPGTLFTAGMRFYQVRDSMMSGKPITIQKNNGSGKVKINEGHILTSNIPATNGVIHAIDILV